VGAIQLRALPARSPEADESLNPSPSVQGTLL
jgi:hypothetical protein